MGRHKSLADRWRSLSIGGPLKGITLGRWIQVLLTCGGGQRGPREIAEATIVATRNSGLAIRERLRFGPSVRKHEMRDPIFIIGYWRSGTTYLHNLFAADERFAYPNHYEVYHPSTFLVTEDEYKASLEESRVVKRAQDNVKVSPDSAAEDEFALVTLTPYSLYRGILFPRMSRHFRQFLSFDDVSRRKVSRWQSALAGFLKKVSWKNAGKRLILKSPGHTARIRILLELYPNAKFVHIHRNPYRVFQSARHAAGRQSPDSSDADNEDIGDLLSTYRLVYDNYFEQRKYIPESNFAEISFEALESDPLGCMEEIYAKLGLPAFGECRQALSNYVSSSATYAKNTYRDLDAGLAERVAREWGRSFEAWGYSRD